MYTGQRMLSMKQPGRRKRGRVQVKLVANDPL